MSSLGAPTRDVLLVSAIITVSLSVTVVLCGLCHWCQRKLVRLLRAALGRGGGAGVGKTWLCTRPLPHYSIMNSLQCSEHITHLPT
jgi:hypothetical protein